MGVPRAWIVLVTFALPRGRGDNVEGQNDAAPDAFDIRTWSPLPPLVVEGWEENARRVLRGELTINRSRRQAQAVINSLTEAAAEGSALAMTAVGVVNLYGIVDTARNVDLAPHHSLFNVLRKFDRTPALEPNVTAAMRLLRNAAAGGDPEALAIVALLGGSDALDAIYGMGGSSEGGDHGRRMLQLGARGGSPLALVALGTEAEGAGRCEEAAELLEAAAGQTIGDALSRGSTALDNAMPNLFTSPASVRMRAGEVNELKAWAERKAMFPTRDTVDAQLTIAQIYFEGLHNVPRDVAAARHFYSKAAASGEGGAMVALGLMELHGIAKGNADLTAAVANLTAGIEKAWNPVDKAMAWNALGHLSLEGIELPQSDAAAIRCFREAAASGYLEGFYNLAVMHYVGRGTRKDARVAAALLAESAASGHQPSSFLLGAMVRRGEGTPSADCRKAIRLLRPVALRHPYIHGNALASQKDAREYKFAQAALRAELLAHTGDVALTRRAGEVRAHLLPRPAKEVLALDVACAAPQAFAQLSRGTRDPHRRDALRGIAIGHLARAGEAGSVEARFRLARLLRERAAAAWTTAEDRDELAQRVVALYDQLRREGYDEARWQLVSMRSRGELVPRDTAAAVQEALDMLLRPRLPWFASTHSQARKRGVAAVGSGHVAHELPPGPSCVCCRCGTQCSSCSPRSASGVNGSCCGAAWHWRTTSWASSIDQPLGKTCW